MSTKTPSKTGMRSGKKPWSAKLRPEMVAEIVPDPKTGGRLLLPTPGLLAEEISGIPTGEILTVPALRRRMAERAGADAACPLMTGIFYNIIAGATEECLAAGKEPLAPYWRVVLEDGSLSLKTPAGPEVQARHLREEGHQVMQNRARLKVEGFVKAPVKRDASFDKPGGLRVVD